MGVENEPLVRCDDDYLEKQYHRTQTILKGGNKTQSVEHDAFVFWGMCLVVATTIVFGPTILALLGIL